VKGEAVERFEHEEDEPDVNAEFGALAFQAGYGQAILDRENANSSDAIGDRIVEASRKLHGAGLWDSEEES
jgi:hypothetical protein